MASTGFVLCSTGLAPLAHARITVHSRRATLLMGPRAELDDRRSRKGKSFENKGRRRGRPAWLRSPYDTPLRDGNRDRLIGLLTERAAKTLMVYLMETNPNVYHWLLGFYKANSIPKNGNWDDVSGEAFLRKLLSMPIEEARFKTGRDAMYENVVGCGVDPRNIAQRIMDIRSQLAAEFIQDLRSVSEENSLLLRETLHGSLSNALMEGGSGLPAAHPSSSSSSSSDSPTPRGATPTSARSTPASPPPGKGSATPSRPQTPPPQQPRPPAAKATPPVPPSSPADIVRSLNAQLGRASSPGGADGGAGAGAGAVSPDVLAQLRRALEASDAAASAQQPGVGHPELDPDMRQEGQQQEGGEGQGKSEEDRA